MAKKRHKPKVDETWLHSVREDLEEAGCDEMFIETTLEELRAGGSVSVSVNGKLLHFGDEFENQ